MDSINNTLPYYELQYLSKQWHMKISREARMENRIKKLRPSIGAWLFWCANGFGILSLFAISVAQHWG